MTCQSKVKCAPNILSRIRFCVPGVAPSRVFFFSRDLVEALTHFLLGLEQARKTKTKNAFLGLKKFKHNHTRKKWRNARSCSSREQIQIDLKTNRKTIRWQKQTTENNFYSFAKTYRENWSIRRIFRVCDAWWR